MKHVLIIIGYILITTFIFVLGIGIVFGLPRIDTYLKLKAHDECARAATYTFEQRTTKPNGESTTIIQTEPFRQFYKICLEDKGYSTKLDNK